MKQHLRKQIRTLWILFSKRWGGPEQVAISDISDLARENVHVNLMCLEGSPLHAAAMRIKGINVIPIAKVSRKIDPNLARIFRAAIEKHQINIVQMKDENLLFAVTLALRGHPEVSLIANRYAPIEGRFKKWYMVPLFQRLDYMVVLSESIRSSLLSYRPITEKKMKVINLGLDFTKFDPAKVSGKVIRDSWGADKDTIVIGSVGRLDPSIGQDTFLRAAAGLMKFKDRKMKFVIVSEDPILADDEYVESLKELTRLFHMDQYVTYATLGDNLPEIMSAFDIFVMPGREEVPGLGALEALAMERPVVLSRVGGAEDIVGRDEFGLLVRPEDAYDLQQKILDLLDNPSRRLTMGVNGRKYVLKHYDKRVRFLRMLEVYERCMKRRFAVALNHSEQENLGASKD